MTPALLIAIPLIAAALCALLIVALKPLLIRYALARPNARSSHSIPTPQGGGVGVIVAAIVVAAIATLISESAISNALVLVFAATLFIACVGAVDDLRPIPVLPRLALQTIAVAVVLVSLPTELRIFDALPFWIERVLLLVAGLWFVNLVNFMDGLDWITVAEIVPVTAALALFGLYGYLPAGPTITALALFGAMVGFAPFNRPVAKLFLGDVGSLPIGLLTGWCLIHLAASGHLAAAILLPLYYLADATLTLLRRLLSGEAIWMAHRSHFYQRATDNGFSVMRIVTEVAALNIILAILAFISVVETFRYVDAICVAIGAIAVALVMLRFSRKRDT